MGRRWLVFWHTAVVRPPELAARIAFGWLTAVVARWILRDRSCREFLAGSVPAELNLAPGQKSQILGDAYSEVSKTRRPAAGYRRHDRFCEQGGVRRWHALDSHAGRLERAPTWKPTSDSSSSPTISSYPPSLSRRSTSRAGRWNCSSRTRHGALLWMSWNFEYQLR